MSLPKLDTTKTRKLPELFSLRQRVSKILAKGKLFSRNAPSPYAKEKATVPAREMENALAFPDIRYVRV